MERYPKRNPTGFSSANCSGSTPRHVNAHLLIALAQAWEECAELDRALAATYRRHAAQLREIVATTGVR